MNLESMENWIRSEIEKNRHTCSSITAFVFGIESFSLPRNLKKGCQIMCAKYYSDRSIISLANGVWTKSDYLRCLFIFSGLIDRGRPFSKKLTVLVTCLVAFVNNLKRFLVSFLCFEFEAIKHIFFVRNLQFF